MILAIMHKKLMMLQGGEGGGGEGSRGGTRLSHDFQSGYFPNLGHLLMLICTK